MLEFCGQELCMLDGNGRIKLSAAWLRDFRIYADADIVLHCVPEGAIAIYPSEIWQRMRGDDTDREVNASQSVVYRRNLRRFGAMSQPATISNQGRVTIPPRFREFAGLTPGSEVYLIGCEIGLEVWNVDHWAEEVRLIQKHVMSKGEYEMNTDLQPVGGDGL